MLILGHGDQLVGPHDLWTAWSFDPLVAVTVVVLAFIHDRGRIERQGDRRHWLFVSGLIVVVVAVMGPVDALGRSLASAHMVQHLLLFSVASPLIAFSRPGADLLRGMSPSIRRLVPPARRRLGLSVSVLRRLRHPALAWLFAVGTLWLWHSRLLYELALDEPLVHAIEHASFLAAGLGVWSVVAHAGRPRRVEPGLAIIMLFTLGLASTLLAALMTFAPEPWYEAYATTTEPWGLDHLDDQRLAGLLMWFPVGILYVVSALVLLVRWLGGDADGAGHSDVTWPEKRTRPLST